MDISFDFKADNPPVRFLEQFIPEEIKYGATDQKVLFFGMGRDLWTPFGILNAKEVIVYDLNDGYWDLAFGPNPIATLYGLATHLIDDLLNMDAVHEDPIFDEENNTFEMKLKFRGTIRTLKVIIQDILTVERFPEADWVIDSAGIYPDIGSKVVDETNSQYYLIHGDVGDEIVNLIYPLNMTKFVSSFPQEFIFEMNDGCRQEYLKNYVNYQLNVDYSEIEGFQPYTLLHF